MISTRILGRANLGITPSRSNLGSQVGATGCGRYTSQAASSLQLACDVPSFSAHEDEEYADVDWDKLGFGLVPTDYMYVMKCAKGSAFERGGISPYGNIELSPSAGVLNYGQVIMTWKFAGSDALKMAHCWDFGWKQGLFEGLKAHRTENGSLLLFQPEQNAIRMRYGAERMCMPSPTVDQFLNAVKQTALANKRGVPPPGRGSLYIRPLLVGSGPILGLGPSPEYTFLIYASPVRNYFKARTAPLNLYVEDEFDRASRGGTGGIKTISNYAPVLKALTRAKERGFSDVLYLDSVGRRNIEEVSSCNIFMLKGNVLSTPATKGTILSGVTRRSILELSRDLGYEVEERAIPVEELLEADEVFCTGTAVVVASVGSITYQDRRCVRGVFMRNLGLLDEFSLHSYIKRWKHRVEFRTGGRMACRELYDALVGIQTGEMEDKHGWVMEID
ncbi:hypothetical protein MLD38_034498 [Melastoma candidum]|uniref:Uncharacterized protein n=1 Tax=Melastoma candidum TaxID=119954 RepID=A0ACB9MC75_9MYRT|nr:hypothetical protein MLD38_034498 [Melastoma candidum]